MKFFLISFVIFNLSFVIPALASEPVYPLFYPVYGEVAPAADGTSPDGYRVVFYNYSPGFGYAQDIIGKKGKSRKSRQYVINVFSDPRLEINAGNYEIAIVSAEGYGMDGRTVPITEDGYTKFDLMLVKKQGIIVE
ncbi:hypothetical protein HZC35_00860 [Candidatus Saganbacteria bacterium]|nr:hypothetical protein [Candidatus Saganbacteria bacterium]